jgi:hypothetical protein
MEPIAKYREEWSGRRCTFELFADEVRVRGQTPGSEFETTVPLASLQPRFERVWVYTYWFYSGIFVFLLGIVGLGVVSFGLWKVVGNEGWELSGFFVGGGALIALWNARKVEVIRFLTDAAVPALEVVRAGKQEAEFDQFITLLLEHIKKARTPT